MKSRTQNQCKSGIIAKCIRIVALCATTLVVAVVFIATPNPIGQFVTRAAIYVYGKVVVTPKLTWCECSLEYPGKQAPLNFLQKSLGHPFLAEYEYKIRFGTGKEAVECWLPVNTGGRTLMHAYWYPADARFGPCIRLQDQGRNRDCLVSLQEKKTYLILRDNARICAGEISESNPGWGSAGGAPPCFLAVGRNNAFDIAETSVAKEPGQYIGSIDGRSSPLRFVPASGGVSPTSSECGIRNSEISP